ITLNGDVTMRVYPTGYPLTLRGQISGSGGFTKTDLGTLQLFGNTANSYAGNTFIQAGVCQLGTLGAAIPNGTLTIGDNLVSSASVSDGGFQLGIGVPVRVNNASVLDLIGGSEFLGLLTLDGGTVQTGTRILNLGPGLVSTNSTDTNQISVISGNLN